MKMKTTILAMFMSIMMFAMLGCFNEQNAIGDTGKGVKLERNDKSVVVSSVGSFVGAEIVISGKIDEKNILAGPNTVIIEKINGENTIVAVAGLANGVSPGDVLFTVKNAEKAVSVEMTLTQTSSNTKTVAVKRAGVIGKLLGDFNGDNTVSLLDLKILKDAYGNASGAAGYNVNCDIAPAVKLTATDSGESWGTIFNSATPDSKVGLADFVVFANNFDKKPTFQVTYDLWALIKGTNTDVNAVTANLALITSNGNDTITWSSSDVTTVSVSGTVTRGDADKAVTLTANVSRNSGLMTASKTVQITVSKKQIIEPTDKELVDAALLGLTDATIKNTNTDLANITKALTLPLTATNGTTFSWSSSDATAVSNTGAVTQASTDKTVTLTVTGQKGTATGTKTFTVVVKAAVVSTGITVYMEKPTTWSKIFIWYDVGSDNVWETTTVGAAPGDMTDDGSGWYKKVFDTSVKTVTFLFNDGSANWANKFNSLGFNPIGTGGNFVETKSVWFAKDGTKTYEDPRKPSAPTITLSPADGATFYTATLDVTVTVSGTNVTEIKYTTNGSDPATAGTTIASGGKITIGSDMQVNDMKTIKVYAKNDIGPANVQAIYTKKTAPVVTNDIDSLRIYQVMVCSFMDGDPSIGYQSQWAPYRANGDLQGIINSLDYIKGLGCNALWMTPIFATFGGSQAHNGYFANDYFNIDSNFGSNETFKKLVDTAHEKGLYVILDGVLGHNAGGNLSASPSGKRPDGSNPVNYQDGGNSLAFYKEVVSYWIKNYKIDGWRFDQSYQLGPGDGGDHKGQGAGKFYWDDIRLEIEAAVAANKAAGEKWGTLGYMVGEDWDAEGGITRDTYGTTSEQGVHSAFDFPVRYRLVQTLAREESGNNESTDASKLKINHSAYPAWAHPNLMIGNHDVARFGDLINYSNTHKDKYWDRHKAAISYLGAYSGPITIYYGEEWGSKTGNSDVKSMHVSRNDGKISGFTTEEEDLRQYTAKVMKLRAENSALWQEKTGNVTMATGTKYIDEKSDPATGNKVIYCLNIGSADDSFTVNAIGATKLIDGITDEVFTGSGTFTIPMKGLQGRYLIVQ